MPKFQVVISKYLESQSKNLKEALQEKLADGKTYIIRFYGELPENDNTERFLINAEYPLIKGMMNALGKEFPNFKVEHPVNNGIGFKWAEVSEDNVE